MADQDVSDVLDDPDFNTTILLRRASVHAREDGLADVEPAWLAVVAVVIPDGGQDLVQTPAGDQVQGDITVYSRRDLTAGGAELSADQIEWDGARYKVLNAQSYRYGTGYTRAVCQQMDLNPSLIGSDEGDCDGSALDP